MNDDKVFTLLGFAQRAGALVSGDMAVKKALEQRTVRLLIVASDAADRTKSGLVALAGREGTDVRSFGSKDALGRAIGKSNRSAVAIKDAQLATALLRILQEEN